MAEIVGAVDQQVGVVLLGCPLVVLEVRRVGVHREEPLSDDEDGIVGVGFASLLQHALHLILVEVLKLLDVPGGRNSPLLQAVVRDMVHDHVVPGPHQCADHPEAAHPPGRKDQHVHAPVLLELLLQLHVQPA